MVLSGARSVSAPRSILFFDRGAGFPCRASETAIRTATIQYTVVLYIVAFVPGFQDGQMILTPRRA